MLTPDTCLVQSECRQVKLDCAIKFTELRRNGREIVRADSDVVVLLAVDVLERLESLSEHLESDLLIAQFKS